MKTFWISWWDNPIGQPGELLPEGDRAKLKTWITGYRDRDGTEEQSICARVEADTLEEAWKLTEVMYPGARSDVRFEDEVRAEAGATWWPPEDRFPRGGR